MGIHGVKDDLSFNLFPWIAQRPNATGIEWLYLSPTYHHGMISEPSANSTSVSRGSLPEMVGGSSDIRGCFMLQFLA